VFPKLERLELSSIDLEEIQHNQHWTRSSSKLTNMQGSLRFQNLSFLEVHGSGSLKYMLSSSIVRFMAQLKHLHILECKVVEEIILTEDLGEEEEEKITPKVLFPLLECLKLKDLPVLKRFCKGSNIKFPSLRGLWIEKCPKLKSFITNSGIKVIKELKETNIEVIPHTSMYPLFNEEVKLFYLSPCFSFVFS
jgi:hypothetical protein